MGSEEDVGRLYPVAKAVITPVFRASWNLQVEGLENVRQKHLTAAATWAALAHSARKMDELRARRLVERPAAS